MAIRGIFIGIDRFTDQNIRELTGCRRDALALSSLFADTIPITSTVLLDDEATAHRIREGLSVVLGSAEADDTVIVSISSHGTPDHRLVVHDSDITAIPQSTIAMSELADAFKATRARAVLFILDCCFSGAAPARVLDDAPITRSVAGELTDIAGTGRIIIAASNVNEPALEHERHGLLTYMLIHALQAETDTVSLPSVMDDIMHRVRAEAARRGYAQNPVILGHIEGGLVLRSLRRGPHFTKAFPELTATQVSEAIAELSAFGLPEPILTAWQDTYLSGLNSLQQKSVNEYRVLDGKSLVVVAPTSSGKTFIGEMAAAKAIADRRKVVFLFPYRALVNEKYDYFAELYGDRLGMRVVRCTGDYSDQSIQIIRGKYDLALLTYEMFLSLSVSNPHIIDTIGLLVVDEVQFITDANRGIVVELLLTNVLAARERDISPQIVALSAVIGDVNGFAEWLGASLLMTAERPVPLEEGVLDRNGSYQFVKEDGSFGLEQLIPRHEIIQRREKPGSQDVIVPLTRNLLSLNSDERIIVFRNNRGSAEGCALYLARDLGLPGADDSVMGALPTTDLSTAAASLRTCLQGGTAFHTTNLGREERVVVEKAFRDRNGKIRVLAATTTVAAGINTPASTVVLAEQEFKGEDEKPYTIAEYKNMAGRAGRLWTSPRSVGAPDGQHNGCPKGAIMAKRRFTREFKVSAVKLVQEQGYSPAEAARSLGVDPASVRGWVAKLGQEAGLAPTGEGALAAELRRLRKENAQLRMEREILKKAAAFFAKEQP